MAVRFLVLPRILHGLGVCCHCSLKWQIDASDGADVFRWCNEIIMIQLLQKKKQKRKETDCLLCSVINTSVFHCRASVF